MGSPAKDNLIDTHPPHTWLKKLNVSIVPGPMDSLLEEALENLGIYFDKLGHVVEPQPTEKTDLVLTTAKFGEPLPWRDALIFTIRKRFDIHHTPTLLTLLHVSRAEFDEIISTFEHALEREEPNPENYDFPGLAPNAYKVLHEQGRRGGAILTVERLVQAQSKCIRTILIVGDDKPEEAYHFDLVGAHPASDGTHAGLFYTDIVLRVVTTMSTYEITEHEIVTPPITEEEWHGITTPTEMINSAQELGKRHFFTDMVLISDIVSVPAVTDAVSSQYSEGCFVTWDPKIDALLTTITGSARPVDKGNISDRDLAVISGVRENGMGAIVRQVDGKENSPPSSEAVEMRGIDYKLPEINLPSEWGVTHKVPVIRSKLHGHRGISAYDPKLIEFIPLTSPYYHYPVSCATEAQATGIINAFARSETLNNPDDPRQAAFTVLPGHGIVIAEKWVFGKSPFQLMWELMDTGALQVDNYVPQGPLSYEPGEDGLNVLSGS